VKDVKPVCFHRLSGLLWALVCGSHAAMIGCAVDRGGLSSGGSGGRGGQFSGSTGGMAIAGSGGSGAGGEAPGTGGALVGSGGTAPGTGGNAPGTGGAPPGTGGDDTGSGGAVAGSGGAVAGSGGSEAGTGGAPTGSGGSAPGTGGAAAEPGTGGGGGDSDGTPRASGCADGTREAFLDLVRFPAIAACAGGWSVPGLVTAASRAPACGRAAGNDGSNVTGAGCTVEDLCAEGWHVCLGARELAALGVTCADAGIPSASAGSPLFFATRQRGTPPTSCSPDEATTSNNLHG
jgi:hypothetical protein